MPISGDSSCPLWKILIYDERGQSVLAPIIKVIARDPLQPTHIYAFLQLGELRQHGVTLNLLMDSERYEVEDVTAIYVCEPTEKSFDRISSDLKKNLYKFIRIEFLSYTSDEDLKNFAQRVLSFSSQATLSMNAATSTPAPPPYMYIRSVVDRYADFIALSPSTYTLNLKDDYSALYSNRTPEAQV